MSRRQWQGISSTKIARGDVWDLRTNTGILRRIVKSVAMGVVYYQNCEGQVCRCSLSTFQRWAIGAELSSADDWKNRTTPKRIKEGAA